jgi:hypothetical protein
MRCVLAHHFTVAKARAWRASIDDDPSYQRGGDVWTLRQRQRFIDSLLNGYDVPKIYLHDLRGRHPTKVYAVVDGKQRLTAMWDFLADRFTLADDFVVEGPPPGEIPDGAVPPAGAVRFSQLDPAWQRLLLQTELSVVLIRDAEESDIDELFDRLNDGAPLTAAERRNAIFGAMSGLVREVGASRELADLLPFPDRRGGYRAVAAALIALDVGRRAGAMTIDLDDAALDRMVRDGRTSSATELEDVGSGVRRRLTDDAVRLAVRRAGPQDAPSAIEALRAVWPVVGPAGDDGQHPPRS